MGPVWNIEAFLMGLVRCSLGPALSGDGPGDYSCVGMGCGAHCTLSTKLRVAPARPCCRICFCLRWGFALNRGAGGGLHQGNSGN